MITYGPDLQVAPGEIQAVVKKLDKRNFIFGTVLIIAGIALSVNSVDNFDPFNSEDTISTGFFGGLFVTAIGIGVVIPPTYKKEKGIIEIRRINR